MEPVTGALSIATGLISLTKTAVHICDAGGEVAAAIERINDYEDNVNELIVFFNQHHSTLQDLNPTLLSDVRRTVNDARQAIDKAGKIVERNRTDSGVLSRASPDNITRPIMWTTKYKGKYEHQLAKIQHLDNKVGQKLQDLKRAVDHQQLKDCLRGASKDEKKRKEEMERQAKREKQEKQAQRDAEGLDLLAQCY